MICVVWCSIERGRRTAARVMARPVVVAAFSVAGRCAPTRLLVTPAGVIGWEALDDSIPGEHAPVDREVPADHEGPHGGILLGQSIRFVSQVCLVLAAIDKDQAGIATGIAVAFVRRVLPTPSPAQTCRERVTSALAWSWSWSWSWRVPIRCQFAMLLHISAALARRDDRTACRCMTAQ